MTPIPKAAQPVVWFIRWWVKKPKTLPVAEGGALRELRWCGYCPLGLLPMAVKPTPGFATTAGIGEEELQEATQEFHTWWDSQTDARAAVDAVWGD